MGDLVKLGGGKGEIPCYYTNVFELTIGPYDFTFSFGYKNPEQAKAQKEPIEFDTIAYVSMSPTQAKTAVTVLQEMVARYEKDFGEIPMEKRFKDRYQKIFEK